MTASRLFITQGSLESWLAAGRAEVSGDELLDTATGQRFRLIEGVRFNAEVTGTADAASLVGRVKDVEQLAALGAEHMADSVILGDNAYQVVSGFVGAPLGDSPRAAVPAAPAPHRQTLAALQAFFLNNVK